MKSFFWAKITDESPARLVIHYKKDFQAYLEKNKGKEVEIFIERVSNRRSANQNRLWFGLVVQEVANTTGYTKDEVHDFLARKFLGTRDIIIGKDKITVRRSTTELNKNDFSELVERAKLWAAEELGITIQLPNE